MKGFFFDKKGYTRNDKIAVIFLSFAIIMYTYEL
jgi:hypothetical protein